MSFIAASLLLKNEWVNWKVKQSLSPRIKRMKMLKKSSKRRGHIQTLQYLFNRVSEAENRRNSEEVILKRY